MLRAGALDVRLALLLLLSIRDVRDIWQVILVWPVGPAVLVKDDILCEERRDLLAIVSCEGMLLEVSDHLVSGAWSPVLMARTSCSPVRVSD